MKQDSSTLQVTGRDDKQPAVFIKADIEPQLRGRAYANFQSTEIAPKSKALYELALLRFMRFCQAQTPDDLLTDAGQPATNELLEDRIAAYLMSLKADGLSSNTMLGQLWALKFFYESANRKALAWAYLARKVPRKDMKKTKAYTREQGRLILTVADKRVKAMTLFFMSTGVRVGALPYLKFKHLYKLADLLPEDHDSTNPYYQQMRKYAGYLVIVYGDTDSQYFTFTTPEAAKAIDDYKAERQALGEDLTDESPLFRDKLNRCEKLGRPNDVSVLTEYGVRTIYQRLQRLLKMRPIYDGEQTRSAMSRTRRDVKAVHGFRKFTNTTLQNCRVAYDFKRFLMGHDCGLDKHYYDHTIPESVVSALSEYLKAVDALTIGQEAKLQRENLDLKVQVQEQEADLIDARKTLQNLLKYVDEAKKGTGRAADDDPRRSEQVRAESRARDRRQAAIIEREGNPAA